MSGLLLAYLGGLATALAAYALFAWLWLIPRLKRILAKCQEIERSVKAAQAALESAQANLRRGMH